MLILVDGPGGGWLEDWLSGREDSCVDAWGDDSALVLGREGGSSFDCLDDSN